MSEYRETKTVYEDVPIKRPRPVVETQYDSVVHERGMSGGAIAALVLAAIAAAVAVTMLILNNQQRNSDEEMALERARAAAAAEQANAQPSQQPPVIVMPPQSQPGAVPVPVPVPSQPAPATTTPTSTDLESDVTSKLVDDQELRPYSIDVKVVGATATLSGDVPNDELKARAERLTRTVRGIRIVINNILVKPE